MTIADKLTQLNSIKQDIKTAIINKGQSVNNDMTQYAMAISSISGSAVIKSLNVTPSTSAQTITAPLGTTGYNPVNVGAVTSSIDNNIQAGNIKKNVSILGVNGTYEGGKYGCTVDTLIGEVDANNVLQLPTEEPDLVFTGVEDMANYALAYRFRETKVKSVSFPNLTTLSGNNCLDNCFAECPVLVSVSFPNLTSITGNSCLNHCFDGNELLSNVSFPNLTTLSGSDCMVYAFYDCDSLLSISFPKLATLSGDRCMKFCFSKCHYITDIYFSALTTASFGSNVNQFSSIMNLSGASATHTLHFPSNLETTIQGLNGYPLFGGTSGYVVLSFDLPATE
jgi:hypothetical protein